MGRDDTNNELVVGIIGRLPFAFACFQLVTLLSSGLGMLELYHFSLQPPFPLRVIYDVSNPSFHEVASVYFEPASGHNNT